MRFRGSYSAPPSLLLVSAVRARNSGMAKKSELDVCGYLLGYGKYRGHEFALRPGRWYTDGITTDRDNCIVLDDHRGGHTWRITLPAELVNQFGMGFAEYVERYVLGEVDIFWCSAPKPDADPLDDRLNGTPF